MHEATSASRADGPVSARCAAAACWSTPRSRPTRGLRAQQSSMLNITSGRAFGRSGEAGGAGASSRAAGPSHPRRRRARCAARAACGRSWHAGCCEDCSWRSSCPSKARSERSPRRRGRRRAAEATASFQAAGGGAPGRVGQAPGACPGADGAGPSGEAETALSLHTRGRTRTSRRWAGRAARGHTPCRRGPPRRPCRTWRARGELAVRSR